ncbi:MAG: PAS domain-containing sensor histidine kinase [Bacteroidia bacterium]|nr:PAS domain-containing sensor histidine kinase [Bacteroidia bacterium]
MDYKDKTKEKLLKLAREEFLVNALMDNLTDHVYFKDRGSRFIRINKSHALSFGLDDPDRAIGKTDFDFFTKEHAQQAFDDEQTIIRTGQSVSREERVTWVDRPDTWVSTIKMPLRDNDGTIIGTFGISRDITEIKQAEDAFQNLFLRQEAILAEVPEIIMEVDNNKIYKWANRQGMEFFGKDVIGKEASLYFEGEQETYDIVKPLFDGIGDIFYVESWQRRYDGEKRLLAWGCQVLKDNEGNVTGALSSAQDITERKRAEETLAQEQYLMSTLMENLPDHIYFKDIKSHFIRINVSHAKSLGLTDPDQAVGKTDFDFHTLEHAQLAYNDEQTIIQTGQPLNMEERLVHPNSPDSWVSATKLPIRNKDGNIIGTFGISRDITKRKLAEEEIKLKNELLQASNAEKDKFFSIIAHDLRSPFSHFLGFTQLIDEELHTMALDEIQEMVRMMKISATNLFNLLENLLKWSTMQRGIMDFVPVKLNLKERIGACLEVLSESARKKGIDITTYIPDELEIFADSQMFDTIIRNLVSNAIKFTPAGGKVSVTANCNNDHYIEVKISDSGIGMPQELKNKLFQLNEKTNRNGTEGELSTGLGLLLCKEFIEKHNGKIQVESEEGKGSTFSFALPEKIGV